MKKLVQNFCGKTKMKFYVFCSKPLQDLVTECYGSSECKKIISERGFSCTGSDHELCSSTIVLEGLMF
jgi:hypothetical protein